MPRVINRIMNILVALGALAILVAAILIDSNTTFRPPESGQDFSGGWSYADGTAAELPLAFEDGTLSIVATLPQVDDDAVLLVKCNYKTLRAEVDGMLIYESGMAQLGNISTDTGHYAAIIPLESGHSGGQIRLTLEERDSGVNSDLKYIKLTSSAAYGFSLLADKYIYLTVSIVLYIAAILSLALWIPFKRRAETSDSAVINSLVWVSVFAIALGTWIITGPHFIAVAAGEFALSGLLNYLSLMVIPVAVAGLLRRMLLKKSYLITEILLILLEAAFFVETMLFLLFGVDLSDMLRVFHGSILVSMAVFCVTLITKSREIKFGFPVKVGFAASMLLCAGAVISYALSGDYMLVAIIAVVVFIISVLGHIMGELISAMDKARMNMKYRDFALKDIMTGLGSRLAYSDLCDMYEKGVPEDLTLIYVDVDGLKNTNDRFGHDAGDELIIGAAGCVLSAFGDCGSCFRMGGDEFLATLTIDENELQKRLDLLEHHIRNWCGSYDVNLSVSCGVAMAKDFPGMPFEDLVKEADASMYKRKHFVGTRK